MKYLPHAPLYAALILVAVGGLLLLSRADRQARDTTRKHHLEDIEHALYTVRLTRGTYPPYDQETWCGVLSDPANSQVREQVEAALRAQNDKYANPAKPFPQDPRAGSMPNYFYWKRSPASFELFSVLEDDDNNERNTFACPQNTGLYYDYGIASVWREDPGSGTMSSSPL